MPFYPGTVEVKSAAASSSTVTDSAGVFRFPSLTPGTYEVTATLQGFKPVKSDVVELTLGQVLKVNSGDGNRRPDRVGPDHR